MAQLKSSMAISELSKLSGIPLSTIKFYIREKMLPKPVKTSKTRARYSQKHLDRLTLIKKIQKEGKIPLNKIKEIIEMIDLGQERENGNNALGTVDKKSDIIDSAIPLFREKGYDAITISDIVDASHIGRATFYKYFDNKKDLFLECFQKILFLEATNPEKKGVDDEKDILALFDKYAEALTDVTPLWRDMINVLRAAAINDPAEFADKLEEAVQLKINLYTRKIKRAIKQGIMREINPDVLAVIILGIQEACSEYLPTQQVEESKRLQLLEDVKDIILHGVLKY